MKHFSFTRFSLALTISLMFLSCSHEDEIFSCNPDVNNWVKENKSYIQTLTRAQWYKLDYRVSQASYIAFSPSQKEEFWKEKFKEVKLLNWSSEEIKHIQDAENYILEHEHFFSEVLPSEEEIDDFEIFFSKWVKQGVKNFGWTKKTALAIVGTGYKMIDLQGNVLLPEKSSNMTMVTLHKEEEQTGCNCNTESMISCILDPFGPCDTSYSKCESSFRGCGFVWSYPCDGTCGGI